MKIGIYGGTFNPIHYGHLRTAEEVFERFSLDSIIFVPSGKTPFDKPDLARAADRYEMVRAAIKGNPHFTISDIEIRTRGRSFTVNTVRKLTEQYKNCELYFILGADAFLDFHSWKHPDSLIEMINFIVISRPGYPFSVLSSLRYLKGVKKKALAELDREIIDNLSFHISDKKIACLCKVTELNISASYIRSLVLSGKNIKYLLPDSVKSYIISNKLYLKKVRSNK